MRVLKRSWHSALSNGYNRKNQRIEVQERRILGFFHWHFRAFNCTDYNLLINKLPWYGVTTESLNIILSYLSNRTQCVRINKSYSRKRDIRFRVLQSPELGLLLFNIDLIDVFLECEDDNITSYGEGSTPYFCAQDISSVISELRRIAKKVFECFKNNHMKAYPGKRHVILGSNIQREIHSDNTSIASSLNEKLLGKSISIKFAIWLTKN